jgi:hypothetical protein
MATIFNTNANLAFGDDDKVTTVYTYQAFPLGLYREQDGKGYRFVQVDASDVTISVGLLAYLTGVVDTYVITTGRWTVSADVSDSIPNKVRGVFISAPVDTGFCWIQTKGYCVVTTNGDDDIALGDAIIASATGDGTCDSTAAGTAPIRRVVGWAVTVDVDNANTVITDLCLD